MHGAAYLGVHTEGQFQPVHVALHIMGFVWGHAAIVRIDDTGGGNVKLVGGVGIPASGIESVDVVFVFEHVEVDADTAVRGLRLVGDAR